MTPSGKALRILEGTYQNITDKITEELIVLIKLEVHPVTICNFLGIDIEKNIAKIKIILAD